MPRGVYPRTPNQLKAAKKNLAKGRTKEVREKVGKILKENARDPQWRKKVSQATKQAMHSPEIRSKHLAGLQKAREKYGVNFRGGNGQEMTMIVKLANRLFSKCGYTREYPIPTKLVRNIFENVPSVYKADFANPEQKIVIELDGISHKNTAQKKTDRKKTRVLEHLGWTVIRLRHYNQ